MAVCKVCEKTETGKMIDGVPVCRDCMLRDANGNDGKVVDYSHLKEKAVVASPVAPLPEKKPTPAKKSRKPVRKKAK